MSLIARNSLWFSRDSSFVADQMSQGGQLINNSQDDGILQAMANGSMRFTCSSNLTLYSSTSNVSIGAHGVRDVLVVTSNGVSIKGDVRVTGGVDTISTTELIVHDKIIRIAQSSASNLTDISDMDLDGAGLVIGNSKEIKWYQGYDTNPGRWDVRGGGWHISRPFDNGERIVSYGMQINDNEELEFVRHEYSNTGPGGRHQRVFAFGSPSQVPSNNMFPFYSF
jgi:hypothetical protein